MTIKDTKGQVEIYLQSAQKILTDFSELLDDQTLAHSKLELERLQSHYESLQSSFRNTDDSNLKIAVVGSFSCGKSSFINSILGDEVAPVEIKPMTHGVTSFIYGETEKYDADGKEISREEYQKLVQDANNETKHFIVSYPCERLKKLEFMDSPGFGSVSEGTINKEEKVANRDNKLSEDSIARADVVFFLSNITEGIIPNDAFKRLKEICNSVNGMSNSKRRIYIILTWADRKPASQRENILNGIIDLCERENLNIYDYLIYSSMPIEKIKEKDQEIFLKAKEDLFSKVRNLQIIGAELKLYRNVFDKAIFNLHLRHFINEMHLIISILKTKIGTPGLIKKKLMDTVELVIQDTIDYVYEFCQDKFETNSSYLFHNDAHLFSDEVYLVPYGDFVTLSTGEIHSIKKEFKKICTRYGFVLDSSIEGKLKTFFSTASVASSKNKKIYEEVVDYPNDSYFAEDSLADNYLTTCVYLLNEVGGYWKIGFFGDPEKLIAEKSQEIKKVFDNKFRKQISKIFHCNSFFPVMEKSIIEPLFSAINERINNLSALEKMEQLGLLVINLKKRINNLSALEKELTYTPEIRQKKEDKEEATKDIYPNLSSDDIWKML